MLFNSTTFLIFLVIIFLIFWKATSYSVSFGKVILLLGSYIFYGWWDWRFLILIIISSATDFFIGNQIFKADKIRKRKLLLIASLVLNLGMLFFFKYFNFFIESFKALFAPYTNTGEWSTLNIILPVGISFYTFQTLSYTIDIYNRKTEPASSALTFFTFVAFFPQLVAGPIERARNLIPQFETKRVFSFDQGTSGLKLILWGLFKKMVIADQLAEIVNAVYASPERFNGTGIILTTILFGFQIYCDFSGYSDIAIGTARLFGIELMTNFRTPYFSTSFREFWRRWHISLSTWFRDYVYLPLGGNRGSSIFWARNILVTFLISGLWHGASLTFVIWGGIHGILLIAEHFISPVFRLNNKLKKLAGFIITFSLVNFSWLFFRAESWEHLTILFGNIFGSETSDFNSFISLLANSAALTAPARMLLFAFPVFLLIEFLLYKINFDELFHYSPKLVRWGFYYVILFLILFFGVLNTAPQFIYFQF